MMLGAMRLGRWETMAHKAMTINEVFQVGKIAFVTVPTICKQVQPGNQG